MLPWSVCPRSPPRFFSISPPPPTPTRGGGGGLRGGGGGGGGGAEEEATLTWSLKPKSQGPENPKPWHFSIRSPEKFSFLFTWGGFGGAGGWGAVGAGGGGVEGGGRRQVCSRECEDTVAEVKGREDFHFLCYGVQIISVWKTWQGDGR